MYATDGDFGRVRLTSHVFPLAMQEAAACLSAAGWHRVNDRYGISRPAGGGADYRGRGGLPPPG